MRKVFRVLIGSALVFALSVPMALVGSGEVKADDDVKVYINETNFPDENFRQFLLSNAGWYTSDGTGNYYTQEQINAIDRIDCSEENIESLKGIEHFTALTYLYCYYNQLTSLDLTKNTALTYLVCSDNQITSLDVTKNTALEKLYCYSNEITSLDVTKNTALEKLDCSYNEITSLDVTKNTGLTYLDCSDNQLTSLDLSNNNNLQDNWFDGENQTPLADLIIKDKHISFDMKALIGSGADIANVTITSDNWELDENGIANYTGTDFPKELSYKYDTHLPDDSHGLDTSLWVTVSFAAGKYAPTATEYKYSKESGKPLTISFKRETCDSETFWMFKELRVDGEEVNEKYVKLSQGSLNVELAAEFLNSLDNGEHTLSVSFIDGGEATATFTIASKEANNNGTSTSADTTSTTPQTGDSSDLIVYLVIGALAAVGGAMIVASNKMEEE